MKAQNNHVKEKAKTLTAANCRQTPSSQPWNRNT
jgi:hypothetical protein